MRHIHAHSIKSLITLIFITFFGITSLAQNTSPVYVIEFNKILNGIMDEGKLQKNQLTDYDDNPVCLVKVKAQGFDEATLQKLIFVPRNIMMMHKAYENGEYRLYVSSKKPGSILIKYQGEYEFKLPYNLEPKKIYELILGMETATLVIRATPEESVIYVDDEKVGTGNVSQAVSIGAEHRYRVECENYFEKEDVVMLQKGERKSLNIELEPAFGFITVKTTPSGADVYVDDKLVGKTPYLSEVIKRGMHKITVNKQGYETSVQRVNINVNEESNVEFELVEGESSMPVQQVTAAEQKPSEPKPNSQKDTKGMINGHEYVDLGLPSGTLWATCNVGANKPEGYGNFYSWGETEPKDKYNSWKLYKHGCDKKSLTKYNTNPKNGTVDDKTVLEQEDDVANVKWGGSWRMPTYDEMNELKEYCTWVPTTLGGITGCLVTGPNGSSIFIPLAGFRSLGDLGLSQAGLYGVYWSSTLNADNPTSACNLSFQNVNQGGHGLLGNLIQGEANQVFFSEKSSAACNHSRYSGLSVRPVSSPQK